MTMLQQEQSFDATQLGRITRTCGRWMAVEALPAPIRCKLEELDCLSQRLLAQTSGQKDDTTFLLALVKRSCRSLRNEFSKIQVTFVCPSCPLRAD